MLFRALLLWNFEISQDTEDSKDYLINSFLVTDFGIVLMMYVRGMKPHQVMPQRAIPWKGEMFQFVSRHALLLKLLIHLFLFHLLTLRFPVCSTCLGAAQRAFLRLKVWFSLAQPALLLSFPLKITCCPGLQLLKSLISPEHVT